MTTKHVNVFFFILAILVLVPSDTSAFPFRELNRAHYQHRVRVCLIIEGGARPLALPRLLRP